MKALQEAALREQQRVTRRWLVNQPQWLAFEQLCRSEGLQYGAFASEVIRERMWEFAERGLGDAIAMVEAAANASDEALSLMRAAGMLDAIPLGATAEIMGQLQLGSPLRLINGATSTMTDTMARHLVKGVARGTHSSAIGRQIHRTTGMPLSKALTISRTETFRAHREAQRFAWQQSTAVDSWRWVASLGPRTCAACWAAHGRVFPLGEPMPAHPNCRCTMVPVLNAQARALTGLPEEEFVSGEQRLRAAPAEVQRQVLGPQRYAQWQAGKPLESFVQTTNSRAWGKSRTVKPVAA